MKLKVEDYSLINGMDGDFQTITFVTDGGYKIKFTVCEDGRKYFDTDTATLDEINEAIAIIESGKLEINLL